MSKLTSKLIVKIENDPDMEKPDDGWKLHSFNRKHVSYKHPDDLGLCGWDQETGLPLVMDPDLKAALDDGRAFFLSYYEHGRSVWFRKDRTVPSGVEFTWDGVRVAGLLLWEGEELPATLEEREQLADGYLCSYTAWANGDGYAYTVVDEDDEWRTWRTASRPSPVDSCGGFDDSDYMLSEIARTLVGREFEVRGDYHFMAGDLQRKVAELERVGTPRYDSIQAQ